MRGIDAVVASISTFFYQDVYTSTIHLSYFEFYNSSVCDVLPQKNSNASIIVGTKCSYQQYLSQQNPRFSEKTKRGFPIVQVFV